MAFGSDNKLRKGRVLLLSCLIVSIITIPAMSQQFGTYGYEPLSLEEMLVLTEISSEPITFPVFDQARGNIILSERPTVRHALFLSEPVYDPNPMRLYELYLEGVRGLMRCKGNITDEKSNALEGEIEGMRASDSNRFATDIPEIVKLMKACVNNNSLRDVSRSRYVINIFRALLPDIQPLTPSPTRSHDPCASPSLVGTGYKNRNWCTDSLASGDEGSQMVVIPEKKMGITKHQELPSSQFLVSKPKSEITIFSAKTPLARDYPDRPHFLLAMSVSNRCRHMLPGYLKRLEGPTVCLY